MRLLAAALLLFLTACSGEKTPAPLATRSAAAEAPANAPVILAFGDSLYAGYGLKPTESYPSRLEVALNAAEVPVRVVNAGVSGDTTAAARARLAFTLDGQAVKPALVMVGLGGNDMLRGLPPAETRANMAAIAQELKRRNIPFMLTGMLAAPNMGKDYVSQFNTIWPDLAKEYHVPLVPFFLQPVIGNDSLLLDDHIHPNPQGVDRIVAATQDTVAKALKAATKP